MTVNPSGKCMCGCGGTTARAQRSNRSKGIIRGDYQSYIAGHHRLKQPERFVINDETGCWEWIGAIGGSKKHPYGYMRVQGKSKRSHIHFYEQKYGRVPDGLVLDHLCRNTRCVNPDHLEAVTNAENTRRGDGTRLNPCQVRLARALRDGGATVASIARMFDYPAPCMSLILRNKVWKL